MKSIRLFLSVFLLLFLFSSSVFSQNFAQRYMGAISQLYFERQPDPKSEAMGKGLVANYDSEFGAYYNPALTSLGKGVSFNISHTSPDKRDTDYDYIGVSYAGAKFGSISISKYNWSTGKTRGGNAAFHNSIHTLNYSRNAGKEYYAGVNVNLVHLGFLRDYNYYGNSYIQKSSDAITMDIGFLKKINLGDASDVNRLSIFQTGVVLSNVTGAVIADNNTPDVYEALPIIFMAGMSYNIKFLSGNKPDFQSFTHIEYEQTLNDKESPVLKIGEEIILGDFIILRGGFITNGGGQTYSYNYFEPNVTFGVGMKAAFNNFLNSAGKVTFLLDYAGTPPTSERHDFNILALKVNYIP